MTESTREPAPSHDDLGIDVFDMPGPAVVHKHQLCEGAELERLAVEPAGNGRHRLTATLRVMPDPCQPESMVEVVAWPARASMTLTGSDDGAWITGELVLRFDARPAGDLAEAPAAATDVWMTRVVGRPQTPP